MIDDKLHIPIQKDIGEYEQKLFGDMSIRTCVCLAGGFATAIMTALACWLWLGIDPSDATFPIMLATLPFWLALEPRKLARKEKKHTYRKGAELYEPAEEA